MKQNKSTAIKVVSRTTHAQLANQHNKVSGIVSVVVNGVVYCVINGAVNAIVNITLTDIVNVQVSPEASLTMWRLMANEPATPAHRYISENISTSENYK